MVVISLEVGAHGTAMKPRLHVRVRQASAPEDFLEVGNFAYAPASDSLNVQFRVLHYAIAGRAPLGEGLGALAQGGFPPEPGHF